MTASEPRPHVSGWFVEPDNEGRPLLVAIGRAVTGVAALEYHLLLELVRIIWERDGSGPETDGEIARLERLTGGQRLRELRRLGLPAELDRRIGDAIERRNLLVHNLFEVPAMLSVVRGEITAAVEWVERLARDCGELAVELHLFNVDAIEALTGKSLAQMLDMVKSIDVDTVDDPGDRQRLEALLAAGDIDLSVVPDASHPPK
jgi:hypothetical protein